MQAIQDEIYCLVLAKFPIDRMKQCPRKLSNSTKQQISSQQDYFLGNIIQCTSPTRQPGLWLPHRFLKVLHRIMDCLTQTSYHDIHYSLICQLLTGGGFGVCVWKETRASNSWIILPDEVGTFRHRRTNLSTWFPPVKLSQITLILFCML